ncbi:non-hydrolyzing UDP-N-acetylglucosamine 2-epimerase [Hungatella hathewayi]|uniref:non-hydrolyzing UDP-N-acetylglucosamine 2-epimerase n=1 Tax=Hungatella hathewayi TaxID=154046 RepID=UPI00356179E6
MKRLKLMTIAGTRPELIRLSEIIKKADQYFDHVFIHTGQNYDSRLNDIFYEDLELRRPDEYLDVAGGNLGETIGNIIEKTYCTMVKYNPDALLILGDTNSALSAIPAKRLKIPIFHMEAGNRCFDENLPEETNRKIVDHIADVNLPYTEHARRYLLAEGVQKERIYVTGSPMREVLLRNRRKIEISNVLERLDLTPFQYILLSAHREENIDNPENFESLMNAVNRMAEVYQVPVIYSLHPRSAGYIDKRGFVFHPQVRKMPPFSFSDYNKLQENALCVVSDSGTMPEEASISGFTGVCIRTSTERPEAMEKGNFIIAGISEEQLLQAVDLAIRMHDDGAGSLQVADYLPDHVSDVVIRIIQSYTGIVNDRVWRKSRL